MNESATFCVPSERLNDAFRQDSSRTNFPTSSYCQLSHTPSDATTIHRTFRVEQSLVILLKIESRFKP